MRRAVPTDTDAALARLARDVERLAAAVDRLADLPTVVATQARALTDLTELVHHRRAAPGTAGSTTQDNDGQQLGGRDENSASAAPDGEPVAPEWLTVNDPAVAVCWLNELAVWVPAVWQPYLQSETPPCWPWHPDVVAELLVCKTLWDEALLDAPAAGALAAWHDRWRAGAARRIEQRMAGCDRSFGRHKIRGREYEFDVACLDELAEWWATTHGTDPTRPVPGLDGPLAMR